MREKILALNVLGLDNKEGVNYITYLLSSGLSPDGFTSLCDRLFINGVSDEYFNAVLKLVLSKMRENTSYTMTYACLSSIVGNSELKLLACDLTDLFLEYERFGVELNSENTRCLLDWLVLFGKANLNSLLAGEEPQFYNLRYFKGCMGFSVSKDSLEPLITVTDDHNVLLEEVKWGYFLGDVLISAMLGKPYVCDSAKVERNFSGDLNSVIHILTVSPIVDLFLSLYSKSYSTFLDSVLSYFKWEGQSLSIFKSFLTEFSSAYSGYSFDNSKLFTYISDMLLGKKSFITIKIKALDSISVKLSEPKHNVFIRKHWFMGLIGTIKNEVVVISEDGSYVPREDSFEDYLEVALNKAHELYGEVCEDMFKLSDTDEGKGVSLRHYIAFNSIGVKIPEEYCSQFGRKVINELQQQGLSRQQVIKLLSTYYSQFITSIRYFVTWE